MIGRLNIFQQTMVQWNEMHAYNAVHVVRVPQPLDRPRLSRIIDGELERLGLTGLVLDKKGGTFQYTGGAVKHELKHWEGAQNPLNLLEREMETQLNTSFKDDGETDPLRFFVIEEDEAFYLGLAYFHVVAGAESIILLLKNFVTNYLEQEPPGLFYPLDRYPDGYGRLFPLNPKLLIRRVSHIRSLITNLRQSSRPRYHDLDNQEIGVSLVSLAAEQFHALRVAAKRWNVTLNDLFLGLLLKSLAPFAARRFSSVRRGMISVGSIVNIRRDLGVNSLKTLGLFLGSFVVSHPVPEGIPLECLTKDIHQDTLDIKRDRLYLGTPMELWLGRLLLSFRSPEHRKRFYAKHYPLWGGLTNMNLNPLWEQKDERKRINYFRAVSTGPITPLVLSITTVGDIVNIGLSFKKSVFSELGIEGFISDFRKLISRLEVGL
jgi:hypothetical protein